MDPSGSSSGFPAHLWHQLHEASQQTTNPPRPNHNHNRGSRGRGRGTWQQQPHQQQHHHGQNPGNPWPQNPSFMGPESFPPLGSNVQAGPRNTAPHHPPPPPQYHQFQPAPQPQMQTQTQTPPFNNQRHGTPREYQERARGNYGGPSRDYGPPQNAPPGVNSGQTRPYGRPPPRGRLYNPQSQMHYGTVEQQRSMRHVLMKQSDYLNAVGKKAVDMHAISQEELATKENFRTELEEIVKAALCLQYPGLPEDQVKLKCYGSLANGFPLAGCDLDLLLCLPDYPEAGSQTAASSEHQSEDEPGSKVEGEEHGFKVEVRRVLEKVFLDQGYGARLLTNTRVPILRVCQTPTPELLQNLRDNRATWEESLSKEAVAEPAIQQSDDAPPEIDAVSQALTGLAVTDDTTRNKGARGNSGLEFTGDCGFQCDINFKNFVALHNSNLLRTYSKFDSRVRQIGWFVKIWAKARDINTPYRGTLSSYGHVLMVLHYLMNVASPPVIPNLQHLAKIEDDWNPGRKIDLFEGFDVRFVQDSHGLDELHADMVANVNRETPGQLLRGFFQYYGTHQGFHWLRDVISIRTKGGILSKQDKGWTSAKLEKNNVRQRYLLAIEDPFEVDHNVARTVGHHGVVAIRDEFRRAWAVIEKIGTPQELPAEEFLQPVQDRVDTLRQDQESRVRRGQLQMRKDLETQEKALLEKGDGVDPDSHADGTFGNSEQETVRARSFQQPYSRLSGSKLTSTPAYQGQNQPRLSKPWQTRKVSNDSDDEDELADGPGGQDDNHPNDVAESRDEGNKPSGGLCSREEVLLANGFDHMGIPVAWDVETQDGRWLQWRDTKIRRGAELDFANHPTMRELHEQCPFDIRRPNPYSSKGYNGRHERMDTIRPPWPAENPSTKIATMPPLPQTAQTNFSISNSIDGGSFDQSNEGPKNEQFAHSDSQAQDRPVGEIIPWDKTTRGGSWLQFRDSCIRQGTWQHHQNSKYTQVSNECPYNPSMTWSELEEKNQVLRFYYLHTIYRTSQPSHDMVGAAASSTSRMNHQARGRRMAESTSPDGHASSSYQALPEKSLELPEHRSSYPMAESNQSGQPADNTLSLDSPTNDTHSEMLPRTPPEVNATPNPEFLRAQRLAFFANMMQSQSDHGINTQFYSSKDVDDAVNPESADDFRTPVQLVARLHLPEPAPTQDPAEIGATSDHGAGDIGSLQECEQALPNEKVERGQSAPTQASPVQVPATLYPDVNDGSRPRDEDPNIMPIPRTLGFQFDPRQLEDLAVIARGGNGCARQGAAFKLEEEEYEWGGGGMMGWRTSTGPPPAEVSDRHTPYEAGRGDEEGLLGELPGQFE